MTCTKEERDEYDAFMKRRGELTQHIMVPLPVATSEQPYKGPAKRKVITLDYVQATSTSTSAKKAKQKEEKEVLEEGRSKGAGRGT